MWQILCRVTPLLLGPFIAAWILRLSFDTYYRGRGMSQRFQLKGIWASMPFYLWIVLLIVLMARITHTLVSQEYAWITIVILCVGALVACLLQFALGRWIGYHFPAKSHGVDYQDILINPAAANYSIEQKSRITAGQAFGQKNTALGIWLAQMYLNPLAAIGPAAYILWQNLLNSLHLWHAGKAKN
jgi:BASS family bile acid:Na+ symporter